MSRDDGVCAKTHSRRAVVVSLVGVEGSPLSRHSSVLRRWRADANRGDRGGRRRLLLVLRRETIFSEPEQWCAPSGTREFQENGRTSPWWLWPSEGTTTSPMNTNRRTTVAAWQGRRSEEDGSSHGRIARFAAPVWVGVRRCHSYPSKGLCPDCVCWFFEKVCSSKEQSDCEKADEQNDEDLVGFVERESS